MVFGINWFSGTQEDGYSSEVESAHRQEQEAPPPPAPQGGEYLQKALCWGQDHSDRLEELKFKHQERLDAMQADVDELQSEEKELLVKIQSIQCSLERCQAQKEGLEQQRELVQAEYHELTLKVDADTIVESTQLLEEIEAKKTVSAQQHRDMVDIERLAHQLKNLGLHPEDVHASKLTLEEKDRDLGKASQCLQNGLVFLHRQQQQQQQLSHH